MNAKESSTLHVQFRAKREILDYSFWRGQVPSHALRHDRNDPGLWTEMAGQLTYKLKGQEPTWYRRKIHLGEGVDGELLWPPKVSECIASGADGSTASCG